MTDQSTSEQLRRFDAELARVFDHISKMNARLTSIEQQLSTALGEQRQIQDNFATLDQRVNNLTKVAKGLYLKLRSTESSPTNEQSPVDKPSKAEVASISKPMKTIKLPRR